MSEPPPRPGWNAALVVIGLCLAALANVVRGPPVLTVALAGAAIVLLLAAFLRLARRGRD